MGIYEDIMAYRPCCEQEERDREVMLESSTIRFRR